jgi:thiamine pyrophosphate-dependent acetolactate synthase large subunit-like protein
MHGYEIIQELASILTGDELIVSSNGNISRQAYHYLPRPQIYLRGSMGLAVPVGLGVAMARPDKQVLVLVGDGNLLMGLGSMVTASFIQPNNLKILILDNNSYATTGHQDTTSGKLNYPSMLDGFGMPNIEPIERNDRIELVRERLQNWVESKNLSVLPVLVDAKPPLLSNIPWHPEKIAELQRDSIP